MNRVGITAVGALALAIGLLTATQPLRAAGPTFRADYRFTGTTLSGFTPLGPADWKVQNGEIVGTPKDPNGGWLLLSGRSLQDLQVYANAKCAAGCKAGVLMRAERMADGGLKGVLLSITEGDLGVYLVRIDAQGREVSREAIPAPLPAARAGGAGAPGAAAGRAGGGGAGRGPGPAPAIPPDIAAQLPANLAQRPTGAFAAGAYNDVEVLINENTVSPRFNGGALGGGGGANRALPETAQNGFGLIGLCVGGTGEARFKDFMYQGCSRAPMGPRTIGTNWRTVRLDPHYYAWSAAVADFNKDGNMDVVAGAYAYFGPDYQTQRQVYMPKSFNPTAE